MKDLQDKIERMSIPIPECGCYIWTGADTGKIPYGRTTVNGKLVLAHRASYEVYVGPIPDKMHVLHTCDVPLCVNPSHLFLGTHTDNMRDKIKKGRGNYKTGSKHGMAILSESDVVTIKALLKRGIMQKDIAPYYGVDKSTISLINRNINWSHV